MEDIFQHPEIISAAVRDIVITRKIADHLYAAALAYDRLVKYYYPEYRGRSEEYFAVWDWYESYRKSSER